MLTQALTNTAALAPFAQGSSHRTARGGCSSSLASCTFAASRPSARQPLYRRRVPGWTDTLQVFCADIGSIAQKSFAWARGIPGSDDEEVHEPGSIESLARAVVFQLEQERPVALGFEMPLFVPVPVESSRLGKARPCDVNAPPWSSGPGGT